MTAKGVALLLNGLPCVRHVVYDMMSEVLTFVDFNAGEAVAPKFGLNSMIFHKLELVGSNHLDLVTKLMPAVEWLSIDSALYFNLDGIGKFENLTLFRVNYKSRAVDASVLNFFHLNSSNLKSLHLVEVKDLSLEDLRQTVGRCSKLENLVMVRCSFKFPLKVGKGQPNPIPETVEHLQLYGCEIDDSSHFLQFVGLFENLKVMDMDRCCLDKSAMELLLASHQTLRTLNSHLWPIMTERQLMEIQASLGKMKNRKERFSFNESRLVTNQTRAARLLSAYAGISPVISYDHDL